MTGRNREDDRRHESDAAGRRNEPSEEELMSLMAAYQGGDAGAFDDLFTGLAPRIRAYLTSLARDRVRADDLLQETFMQVHRARHTYQPGRPVRPWVYAIARNVFLMDRRAAGRRGRHEGLAADDLPEVPVGTDADSVVARQTLDYAVRRLGAKRCEPLLLHHLAGLSFREVGRILGISEGAAKVRAHRVMSEIREVLDEGGADAL